MTSTQHISDTEKTVWTTPSWATNQEDVDSGMRYSLMATTIAVQESDFLADDPTPIKVEGETYDHLSVVDGELRVTAAPPWCSSATCG